MNNDFLPFHKPHITDDEINEVIDTVRSGWWTTGPKAKRFEEEFNNYIGAKYSLAANSWTAAAAVANENIPIFVYCHFTYPPLKWGF